MTDTFTKAKRSWIMRQVKSEDTTPEILLRELLFKQGFKYKLKNKLPGKPDVIIPSKRVAIFLDGCFWHKCPKCFREPRSNRNYWRAKVESNVKRDKVINKDLKLAGWKVIRLWEHKLRENPAWIVTRLKKIMTL